MTNKVSVDLEEAATMLAEFAAECEVGGDAQRANDASELSTLLVDHSNLIERVIGFPAEEVYARFGSQASRRTSIENIRDVLAVLRAEFNGSGERNG